MLSAKVATMSTSTLTKTTRRWRLKGADLTRALGIRHDAEIYVMVPGGGDWSNCRLDIGDDADLIIVETTTAETEE